MYLRHTYLFTSEFCKIPHTEHYHTKDRTKRKYIFTNGNTEKIKSCEKYLDIKKLKKAPDNLAPIKYPFAYAVLNEWDGEIFINNFEHLYDLIRGSLFAGRVPKIKYKLPINILRKITKYILKNDIIEAYELLDRPKISNKRDCMFMLYAIFEHQARRIHKKFRNEFVIGTKGVLVHKDLLPKF